jgi:hypothetical protein
MRTQKIQNRQPSALQGVGLVLLVALAAVAGSLFFTRLEARLGRAASLLFILYGCAIAWFLLDWYVLCFIFTASADCLRVCRAYGKRERFIMDVRMSQVTAYGAPDDVKRRFPNARVTRATRPQCDFEPLALAFRQEGRDAILVLQPNEALRAHLIEAIRAGKR